MSHRDINIINSCPGQELRGIVIKMDELHLINKICELDITDSQLKRVRLKCKAQY